MQIAVFIILFIIVTAVIKSTSYPHLSQLDPVSSCYYHYKPWLISIYKKSTFESRMSNLISLDKSHTIQILALNIQKTFLLVFIVHLDSYFLGD